MDWKVRCWEGGIIFNFERGSKFQYGYAGAKAACNGVSG